MTTSQNLSHTPGFCMLDDINDINLFSSLCVFVFSDYRENNNNMPESPEAKTPTLPSNMPPVTPSTRALSTSSTPGK